MSVRGSARARVAILVLCLCVPAAIAARAQGPPTPHHPGQWTLAETWPGRVGFDSVHAVHMALLRGDTLFARPHSRVMAWGVWSPTSGDGGLWAWNPTHDAAALAGTNLTPLSVPPPPYNVFCAGHTTLPDESGDLLIVSGTERGKAGPKKSARFDAQRAQWLEAPMRARRWYANATALSSGGRVLATAGNIGHQMLVFGGRGSDGALVSDVRRLTITDAGEWDLALTGSGAGWPAPREFHTLAGRKDGPWFLFGGRDEAGTRADVWQLHRMDGDRAQSYRWRSLAPANTSPDLNRWRHASVVIPPQPDAPADSLATLVVHGGERESGTTTTMLADLWKLEWVKSPAPGHWEWTEITGVASGDVPTVARSGHSIIWDRVNNRAVMFGGQNADGTITDANVYVLTFPGGVPLWRIAPPGATSPVPAARTRHAMAANRQPEFSTGVLFGGRTAEGLSNELWEFKVSVGASPDTVTWSRRVPAGTPPAPRADASIVGYEEFPTSYIIQGGELEGGAWDATAWEIRTDRAEWQRLTPSAPALRGHRAVVEPRLLTALEPEVYDAAANTWSAFGQPKHRTSYHMMFLASDGLLYSPGPNHVDTDSTWRLDPDPASGAWSLYTALHDGTPLDGTVGGILYRPNLIMKCGGFGFFERRGITKSLQTGLPSTPAWRTSVNTLGLPRADNNLSMLPTGEVIATGGVGHPEHLHDSDPENDEPRKRPEIWDPDYTEPAEPGKVGYWYGARDADTLAAEPVTRGHHSSALILPDGRVISGGGWDPHPSTVRRTVDQFSPPYLFEPDGTAATRPRLLGAQEHITWNEAFKVACPDSVVEACLIRPGAITHAFNQDNRYVPLAVLSQVGHQVLLRIEGDRNFAPPGNYLLFVLRREGGREVPSVARWVNVGEAATLHDTWDLAPPHTITDLVVTSSTSTRHTLQWTAPASDLGGSTGRVARYEIRYRSDGPMETLEEFFEYGTPVAAPDPLDAGQVQTLTVDHAPTVQELHFRIISRDAAGHNRNWSAMSNEARTSDAAGGCPFVDTRTASGWEVENSVLARSPAGTLSLDGYRLKHAPEVGDGRVRLRMRENEKERTTLDQVRLIAVDHAPGVRAHALGEAIVVGARSTAPRVMTSRGADVSTLLNGTGAGFVGGPGDTLLVEFTALEPPRERVGPHGTLAHDLLALEDGGKCPPDCAPLLWRPDPLSARSIDEQVLENSGIQLQAPDGLGGWRTVLTRYPREHADEAVFEGLGHGPVRLVFVGRHRVRFVGRLEVSGEAFITRELPLLSARHSRLGEVAAAVDTTGDTTLEIARGDSVHLEFAWAPVPEGQVREYFLLSHGAYTTEPTPPQKLPPERFALRVPLPNPFAASTLLRFDLPVERHVRLEVLDAQGRRIRTLANHALPAGSHAIEWDGRNETGGRARPGMYFYRFEAGDWSAHGRLTLVP